MLPKWNDDHFNRIIDSSAIRMIRRSRQCWRVCPGEGKRRGWPNLCHTWGRGGRRRVTEEGGKEGEGGRKGWWLRKGGKAGRANSFWLKSSIRLNHLHLFIYFSCISLPLFILPYFICCDNWVTRGRGKGRHRQADWQTGTKIRLLGFPSRRVIRAWPPPLLSRSGAGFHRIHFRHYWIYLRTALKTFSQDLSRGELQVKDIYIYLEICRR